MTTPTSHGATEPHPVSEGLTDALGGGGSGKRLGHRFPES